MSACIFHNHRCTCTCTFLQTNDGDIDVHICICTWFETLAFVVSNKIYLFTWVYLYYVFFYSQLLNIGLISGGGGPFGRCIETIFSDEITGGGGTVGGCG